MKKILMAAGLGCASLLLFSAVVVGQPIADYGDAPDPTYPSLFASGGPYHTDLTDSYVGWMSTPEADALVPDLDADDGAPVIFASNASGIWTAWVYVPVTLSAAAPNIPRYLNVALDVDASGTWCNIPGEWVVRNYTVYWQPGLTLYYCIGGFTSATDFSGMHWLRVTVSDSPVSANTPNGWDGSWPVGFLRGETEDWNLQWHYSPHGPVPPNDPANPPAPIPLPECNKSATIYQVGTNVHRGHSGSFGVGIKNDGTHPIHITEGPFVTGPYGDPITITIEEDLASTVLQPGEAVQVGGTWDFGDKKPPSRSTCDFEVVHDPQGQTVVVANVGDYRSATSEESRGGAFEDPGVSSVSNLGMITLVLAVLALSMYLIVRRRRLSRESA